MASTRSAAISASAAPVSAALTIARSSRRFGAKMPGVSMKTIWVLSLIAMPRTRFRVVCTFGETIETLEPTSALSSVDFPAFGAPTSATKPQRAPSRTESVIELHAVPPEQHAGRRLLRVTLRFSFALGGVNARQFRPRS